jgi:hypothetical protein
MLQLATIALVIMLLFAIIALARLITRWIADR